MTAENSSSDAADAASAKLAEFHDLVHHSATVKQACDVTAISGGKFLSSIRNSLNGLRFGFGMEQEQIKITACLHGPVNMLNFDDSIWRKYKVGEWLDVEDPATGQPAVVNPFYASKAGPELRSSSEDSESEESLFKDTSMQALQHRGVQFLSCQTATKEQAEALIKARKLTQKPEEIMKEMMAHLVPGTMVVPSMVAALALLQVEGRYSYLRV